MRVIRARNVNDAFFLGNVELLEHGVPQNSRAGKVLVHPDPVTTVYSHPMERVLFHSVRDANPVFHLMEALWMLAGRHDATFLDQFVGDFSKRFAEDNGVMHGAYGFRWRYHFDIDGGGVAPVDQLNEIVALLKENPDDRRVVLTMWDPMADLGMSYRDVPCNTHAYFRIREGEVVDITEPSPLDCHTVAIGPVLDMTVCCRSNDIWWGAYGANAVHFSVLQEYMARRLCVGVGFYRQISNNFHIYPAVVGDKTIERQIDPYEEDDVDTTPIVTDPEMFDLEVKRFLNEEHGLGYKNSFFPDVALPLWVAYKDWRAKNKVAALNLVTGSLSKRSDWRMAMQYWLERRMVKGEKTNARS